MISKRGWTDSWSIRWCSSLISMPPWERETIGVWCRKSLRRLPCQVGGGIRSIEAARETLAVGAHRVILGSSLISAGKINSDFAREICGAARRREACFRGGFSSRPRGHQGMEASDRHQTGRNDARSRTVLRRIPLYAHRHRRHVTGNPDRRGTKFASVHISPVHCRRRDSERKRRSMHSTQMGIDAVVGMAIYQRLLHV